MCDCKNDNQVKTVLDRRPITDEELGDIFVPQAAAADRHGHPGYSCSGIAFGGDSATAANTESVMAEAMPARQQDVIEMALLEARATEDLEKANHIRRRIAPFEFAEWLDKYARQVEVHGFDSDEVRSMNADYSRTYDRFRTDAADGRLAITPVYPR